MLVRTGCGSGQAADPQRSPSPQVPTPCARPCSLAALGSPQGPPLSRSPVLGLRSDSQPNPGSFRAGPRPWSSPRNPSQVRPSQSLLGRVPPQPHQVHRLPPLGQGCPPAVPPPPASCPWRPARPSLAPRPFGERTVSTWSAHLRTAAASAGLGCHFRRMPSSLPTGPPHSPWPPPRPTCVPGSRPQRHRHVSFHLMLMAVPRSCKLSLHIDVPSTYQNLGSPQRGELNGCEAIIAGSTCGKPQEGPLGLR